MKDKRIPDSHITVTSHHWYNFKARLNADGGWCAKEDDSDHWLQVDFFWTVIVSRIQTQGHKNSDNWLTKYTVAYRQDGNSFQPYEENGVVKVENINLNG